MTQYRTIAHRSDDDGSPRSLIQDILKDSHENYQGHFEEYGTWHCHLPCSGRLSSALRFHFPAAIGEFFNETFITEDAEISWLLCVIDLFFSFHHFWTFITGAFLPLLFKTWCPLASQSIWLTCPSSVGNSKGTCFICSQSRVITLEFWIYSIKTNNY